MKTFFLLVIASFLIIGNIVSQEDKTAQANNPLANMTAFSYHNYYMPKLTDAPNEAYMNTAWLRFAKPFSGGKLLFRLSVPLQTVAMPNQNGSINAQNGLGDINAFLAYSFVSSPTKTMGIGPNLTLPTASEDALGTGKWQGGFAFVAFYSQSPVFQYGGLITWQASFAGDNDRSSTNIGAVQPFYFWQLGKGTYLRGAPTWVFDFENDGVNIPFALGIGKVIALGNTMFNLFVEPQYAILHSGTQPQVQIFTGINIQFMGQ